MMRTAVLMTGLSLTLAMAFAARAARAEEPAVTTYTYTLHEGLMVDFSLNGAQVSVNQILDNAEGIGTLSQRHFSKALEKAFP